MDGVGRWSGSGTSGSTYTLAKDFTLAASTSYTDTPFLEFNKDLTSVSLIFIISDASETIDYSW